MRVRKQDGSTIAVPDDAAERLLRKGAVSRVTETRRKSRSKRPEKSSSPPAVETGDEEGKDQSGSS